LSTEALQPGAEASSVSPHAPLGALFVEFIKISLLGFGGGIVLAHRCAVERRRWLSEAEFADALTLCQFMPGPNVVGIAICIGAKTRGLLGALIAFAGFALIPGTIGFTLAVLYLGQAQIPLVQHTLTGISAAAAGLMIGTGLRFLRPHWRDPRAMILAGLAFLGLAIAKLPLLFILAILTPLGVAMTALMRPRTP
jgi:chromate transporter